MKKRIVLYLILLTALAAGVVYADDGTMLRRNVSKSPDTETMDAGLSVMSFYVPAQSSSGELTPVEYYAAPTEDGATEGELVDTRDFAKPLIVNYIDGIEEDTHVQSTGISILGGVAFGKRDAFVALSLDDGVSWKRANVSNSAHLSSFNLADGHEYPGDVVDFVHASAGDRVFAAWISKYCSGGNAAYSLTDENDLDGDGDVDESLYPDLFGVAGAQKSVDYTLDGHPEVGEVPFGCVWTARGQLLPSVDDTTGIETYDVVWTKAERLTSGRRDPNRLEVAGVKDAGFIMVWQEDPEGLRPGTGEGPGEGWSGAIANAKTDVWYSYVGWNDFDLVQDVDTESNPVEVPLADYTGDTAAKAAVPMAMPVRITDNNMCRPTTSVNSDNPSAPYCYVDFDEEIPEELPTEANVDSTNCIDSVQSVNNQGVTQTVCVTEDGRVLAGRVAATRPRIGLHGYTNAVGETSAWVILGYEETKALGESTLETDTDAIMDEGKNLWYHSFDMFNPDLVSHGNILNQPAKDPLTSDFFAPINTTDAGLDYIGASGTNYAYDFYETEIGRRFSLISQNADDSGDSGVVAFTLIKQGIIKQGGPADIFARRFVIPGEFDSAVDNPYAFENMDCPDDAADDNDGWAFRASDGSVLSPDDEGYNPFYPKGICLSNPPNLSGTTAVDCEDSDCPTLDEVYIQNTETGVYEFVIGDFTRVTKWSQAGPNYGETVTVDNIGNLDDQSWENPFDIAKGHRGFMDGDFIQVLYAWSPNYKQNAVGHDHYNLYVRRSFDGGITWTTTPASFTHTDGVTYSGNGTTFTENFGWGSSEEIEEYIYTLGPGEFEPARNVSQLVGSRETILDPRYSPTPGDILTDGAFLYPDDQRDPSKFFIVYETGDNTTVITGEATPLDLFYSRATDWGDDYDLVEYVKDDETTLGWDWLEKGDPESGEAAIRANPGGTFFYAAWNEALEIGDEEFTDMDAYFRRVMYLDDIEAMGTATILYVSHEAAGFDTEEVTFIGTAVDNDHMGDGDEIIAYEWSTDLGLAEGFEIAAGEGEISAAANAVFCTSKVCKKPGWAFVAGRHNISFKAQDNEGVWTTEKTITLIVAETEAEANAILSTNTVYLPLVIKE